MRYARYARARCVRDDGGLSDAYRTTERSDRLDPIANAVHVMRIATGEAKRSTTAGQAPRWTELNGGRSRAESLTREPAGREVITRTCRRYLDVHGSGHRQQAAHQLLGWDRATDRARWSSCTICASVWRIDRRYLRTDSPPTLRPSKGAFGGDWTSPRSSRPTGPNPARSRHGAIASRPVPGSRNGKSGDRRHGQGEHVTRRAAQPLDARTCDASPGSPCVLERIEKHAAMVHLYAVVIEIGGLARGSQGTD